MSGMKPPDNSIGNCSSLQILYSLSKNKKKQNIICYKMPIIKQHSRMLTGHQEHDILITSYVDTTLSVSFIT